MSFKLYSDVRETSNTGGTGNQVLAGALDGSYNAFSSRYANGDTFFYCMKLGTQREIGKGTYNSGANSIARSQVYKSTNANALVNFGAGTVDIFVTNIAPDDLDAAGKLLLAGVLGAVTVIRVQKILASGTYTPDPHLVCAEFEAVGGGGGGGGAGGGNGSTTLSAGGGGGEGGRSVKFLTAAAIGASQAVTIGAGGAPGVATGGNGGVGGTTSVGALLSVSGGLGGIGASAQLSGAVPGGWGGAGSGGDVNYVGAAGQNGMSYTASYALGGAGAGAGGAATGGNSPGNSGAGPGGGGSGGSSTTTNVISQPGGAGAAGYVIVTEYCSQ